MLKNYKNFKNTLIENVIDVDDIIEVGEGETVKMTLTNKGLSIDQTEINSKVSKKIRRCLMKLYTNYGFFAKILYQLKIKQSLPGDGIKTMAVDGISLVYNPVWTMKLTDDEVLFVLCHEVMHCALMHMFREGSRKHKMWNEAADYAINLLVEGIGEMPEHGLYDKAYADMSAEMIYDYLEKNPDKRPNTGGDDKASGGNGGDSDDSDDSDDYDTTGNPKNLPQNDVRKPGSLSDKGEEILPNQIGEKSDLEKTSKADLEKVWKDIVLQASKSGIGNNSSGFKRWIKSLTESEVNWKNELKKFVASIFNKQGTVIPNRRFVGRNEFIWGPKKLRSDYDTVVIAIDTSGSIDDKLLSKFATEIEALSKTHKINEIIVIWCDSEIPRDGIQRFGKSDKFSLHKLKPTGGGGTSFKPPFYWINDNLVKKGKKPAFVIYFTDAEGTAPRKNEVASYAQNVLWVVTGHADTDHLEFGKKIRLQKSSI